MLGFSRGGARPSHFRVVPVLAPSQVRVRNETSVPLQQVQVNGIAYGDIPAGGMSGYRVMKGAYRYAALQATMNGKPVELQPDDYVGETPLGEGHFTYVISEKRREAAAYIEMWAVKDPD
jgi:hypothetical protein